MSGDMDVFPEYVTLTFSLFPGQIKSFEPATMMHSNVTRAHVVLCFVLVYTKGLSDIIPSEIIPLSFKSSQFRSIVVCTYALAIIFLSFGNLLMVDKGYGSLVIIVIILLIFIATLLVILIASPKDQLKRDDNDANKVDISGEGSSSRASSPSPTTVYGSTGTVMGLGGGEGKKRRLELLWMVRLPFMLLCFMRNFNSNMEMTNCLLFLSSSLGELTLMMAMLASEFQVAPAFEVVHRAFLVTGLLTAHTMAAELLGDGVVLVCMPELVAALVWLTIVLASGDAASATVVHTVEAAVRRTELLLLCLVGVVASIIVPMMTADTDEAEGTTDPVSSIMSAIVPPLSLVILPSLCMFALRQWQTTAAPSSELEAAIRLFSLCRDGPWNKALAIVFLAKPVLLANKLVVHLMFPAV